jgi:predicted patatin/cPLA2 family phospholipase
VSNPIPIEKSIEDGNRFHVIVLTRNQGYVHEAFRQLKTLKLLYKKYPYLIKAMMDRHEVYNRQLLLCEQLEREKKAIIIRPQKPLVVDRVTTDTKKLMDLYDEGHTEGKQAMLYYSQMSGELGELFS